MIPTNRDVSLLEVLVRMMLAIAFVYAVAGGFGCGGPPRVARTALSATATALVTVDTNVTPLAVEASIAARAAALAAEEAAAAVAAYDSAMLRWVMLERVMVESRGGLLALESALDAWAAGADDGKARWLAAVACAIPILMRLSEALVRADVPVPDKLDTALSLLVGFTSNQCPRVVGGE